MGRAKLQRSGHCLHGTHERCPHSSDVAVGVPWRPRPRAEHVLTVCVCDCHVTCPLAGQGTVVRELWGQQCACPGAGLVRERQERAEELRRGVAGVVAEVKRERPSSPEEIETRLRAVYARHGSRHRPG